MRYLRLKNWEHYQHYSDRNPPWIKIYYSLLDNYDFTILADEVKWHVVASTLLASRTNNKIPYDAEWISRKISATKTVDIPLLLSSGMFEEIQLDAGARDGVEQNASKLLDQRQRQRKRKNPPIVPQGDKFEEFWEGYPRQRRGDRDQAIRAWSKRMKQAVNPDEILIGLSRYAASREVADGFGKGAAAWLNASRWTDQYQAPIVKPHRDLYQSTFGVN